MKSQIVWEWGVGGRGTETYLMPAPLLLARPPMTFEENQFPAVSSWRLTSFAAGPAGRQRHSGHRLHPPFAGESEGCVNAPPALASPASRVLYARVPAANHSARRQSRELPNA